MIYTLIRKAERDDAHLGRVWLTPDGRELNVGDYSGTHMMWLFNNQDVLGQKERDEIKELKLDESSIERYASVMYELGWVRVSDKFVLMNKEDGMFLLARYIKKNRHNPELKADGLKKVTVICLNPSIHERMKISQIMNRYSPTTRKMVSSFDKISSREVVIADARQDLIDYYKLMPPSPKKRRSKKKKRANYIPNPDTKVPQPLKRNYDYGEIPNYVDRLKWHNRKERRKKRKSSLDTI